MKRFLTLALVLMSCLPLLAQDLDSLINNKGRSLVTDCPRILSATERKKLETKLMKFDRASSTQIAIVLIRTLDGRALEEVSLELFNTWGIGQQGLNNGLLILAAVNDRKVRIEVGTGLETVISNDEAARIIKEDIVPAFKASKYYDGLNKAANSLMKLASTAFPADGDTAAANPLSASGSDGARPETSSPDPYAYGSTPEGTVNAGNDRVLGQAFFIVLGIGIVFILLVVFKKIRRSRTEGLYSNKSSYSSMDTVGTAGTKPFLGGLLAGWFLFGNRGQNARASDNYNNSGDWSGNPGSSFDSGSSGSDSGSSSFDAGGGFDGGSSSGGGASGDW